MSGEFSALELQDVEKRIGYSFQNKELLKAALTHRSYPDSKSNDGKNCSDRLEFLGSSVMSLLVADRAFEKLLNLKEGALRRLRTKLLKDQTCAEYFNHIDLASFVRMSSSEQNHLNIIGNDRLMTKVMQALLGAVYKDGGLSWASKFFTSKCLPAAKSILKDRNHFNWRKKLQELCHKKQNKQPTYVVLAEEGPDHSKIFKVGVFMDDDLLAKATGKTKKIAATKAASIALEKIE